ncbi:uncharacterized protein GIQ15_01294 [Arthroderma uncinatum]|uniref:uncharacterized protein n=1 Tax=Arthroderma uncinatum TaxID=74035 RepID=UPI00144AEC14|nr:uncharacterized protein GIQ15_01294 [Arthroderma uncinatum]KAF3491777.1 hypothetical protein GIQ15_01294 [Arthroderma uncinatum]
MPYIDSQAISLLLSILSSGSTASRTAFVPPPPYLALAATLAVHPTTTTRSKPEEYRQASNSALQLLKLINKLVGPLGGGFGTAFVFDRYANLRNGGRYAADGDASKSGGISHMQMDPLNLDLAQGNSLWSHAEDFWQVVGWALNCSVLHPKRWTRWYLFLQFMCDILEDDWREREKQFKATPANSTKSNKSCSVLTESLIFNYISTTSSYTGRDRRILKAIFADGSQTSINEYREVFNNELKELLKDTDQMSGRKGDVNIDEGAYGDYLDGADYEEEEELDAIPKPSGGPDIAEPSRAKRQRRSTRKKAEANAIFSEPGDEAPISAKYDKLDHLGSLQSLTIRQRLLHLLSCVSNTIPEHFMSLDKLYSFYVEFIRHLPLPTFQLLVSPSVLTHFPPACQTTLCEMLLFNLLENAAPGSSEKYLSQNKLERCFLPFASNTNSMIDNAKVSILLESLIRLLAANGLLLARPTLTAAVEEGIGHRAEKAQNDLKRSHNKKLTEEFGWVWLIESGERMVYLVNKIIPKEPAREYIVLEP